MCQWNSDFPSCPTTIIKLKAKLGWKAAETLMQDAAHSEKTNGDAGGPSSANGCGCCEWGPRSWARLQPCCRAVGLTLVKRTATPQRRKLLRPEGSVQTLSTESSPKAKEQLKLHLGLMSSSRVGGTLSWLCPVVQASGTEMKASCWRDN